MKLTGPIVTLLAGAALAGGLLVLNLNSTSQKTATTSATTASGTTASGTTASGTTTPPTTGASDVAATQASTPPSQFQATYSTRVTGGRASIAIAVKDGVAIAYFCDGKKLEGWFKGTAQNGLLSLSGPNHWAIAAKYSTARAWGTITIGGTQFAFDAPVVKVPSGLYKATARVRNATVVAGWVVLADGTQVGIVTTDGANPQPAPQLDPTTGSATIGGSAVTARRLP